MSDTPRKEFTIQGRHVLFGMIAFFGTIIAVNVVMMRLALSTHTGVVANEPYRKGLKYNDRIAASEAQAERGWHDKIILDAGGERLSIDIRDKDGRAISGLDIKATIGRPAAATDDVTVTLLEGEAGRYDAAIPRREAGAYVASIEASDRDGVVYRAKERLWQKP